MSWEERARKLEKRRRRMIVQGRGLLTTEPLAVNKRLKAIGAKSAARRSRQNRGR